MPRAAKVRRDHPSVTLGVFLAPVTCMLLGPGGRSPNLEDRRGSRMAPIGIGGGLIMLILGLIFGPGIFSDNGTTTQSSFGDVPGGSARAGPAVPIVRQ